MNVSPLDLRQQKFNKSFRGFDPVEVTAFMMAVAEDYEQALRETDRLRTDLDYLDIQEVLGERMHPYLSQLLINLNLFDEAVTSSFFNTQVVLPGQTAQQQPQQQQQQQ